MNKGDLTSAVAEATGMTKAASADAVNAVLDAIGGALKNDDKVSLIGFGTFSVTHKAARSGRNPRTGKTIEIAAKSSVKFKAGKELTESVN